MSLKGDKVISSLIRNNYFIIANYKVIRSQSLLFSYFKTMELIFNCYAIIKRPLTEYSSPRYLKLKTAI